MLPEVTGTEMRLSYQKVASCVCMRGPSCSCKGTEASPHAHEDAAPRQMLLLGAEAQAGQGNLGQEADGPQNTQTHPLPFLDIPDTDSRLDIHGILRPGPVHHVGEGIRSEDFQMPQTMPALAVVQSCHGRCLTTTEISITDAHGTAEPLGNPLHAALWNPDLADAELMLSRDEAASIVLVRALHSLQGFRRAQSGQGDHKSNTSTSNPFKHFPAGVLAGQAVETAFRSFEASEISTRQRPFLQAGLPEERSIANPPELCIIGRRRHGLIEARTPRHMAKGRGRGCTQRLQAFICEVKPLSSAISFTGAMYVLAVAWQLTGTAGSTASDSTPPDRSTKEVAVARPPFPGPRQQDVAKAAVPKTTVGPAAEAT